MSTFIRLTNIILNKNYIQSIVLKQDLYIINVISNRFNGLHMFGCGEMGTHNSEIKISKINEPDDYKIICDLIKNDMPLK